jgi:hypothetical protein
LHDFGAQSIDEIAKAGAGWFYVTFTRNEVVELIELARRRGLVEPLGQRLDAYGRHIPASEWAPTAAGAAVGIYRGLGAGDLVAYLWDAARLGLSAKEAIGLLAAFALFLAGVSASAFSNVHLLVRVLIVAVGSLPVWGFLIGRGMRGNLALAAAAQSWPRGKKLFPEYIDWQKANADEI